jgi:hypothetical protein
MVVPSIIDAAEFEAVQALLKSRSPALTAPRIVSGPTLLTGICFCAACGMAMTLRTGKAGRYRYFDPPAKPSPHRETAGRSQPTGESRNKTNSARRAPLGDVSRANPTRSAGTFCGGKWRFQDAPLVKCQLLASQFYEALRIRRRQMWPGRNVLFAAVNQCHRTAIASASLAEPCQPIVRQGNDLEREPYREVGNDQEGR